MQYISNSTRIVYIKRIVSRVTSIFPYTFVNLPMNNGIEIVQPKRQNECSRGWLWSKSVGAHPSQRQCVENIHN